MKKMSTETILFLTNALEVANSVNIPCIVIDEDGLRGIDPSDKLVVILKPVIDEELSFESLAIGDVSRFIQRLNIHNNNAGSEILMDMSDVGGVKSLKFKSTNLNIDARCTKASLFNKIIPKRVNDESIGAIPLKDDDIDMIKRGLNTMKAETLMFYKPTDSNDIKFVITDDTKSKFEYNIPNPFEMYDYVDNGSDITFANHYPIKTVLSALKDSTNNELLIGENGSITIEKNEIDIIIPRRLI